MMTRCWVFLVASAILGFILCGSGLVLWYSLSDSIGRPVNYLGAQVVNNPVPRGTRIMYRVEAVKRHVCEVGIISRWIVDNDGVRHGVAKFKGSNQIPVTTDQVPRTTTATFPVNLTKQIPPLRGTFYTEVNYHCLWRDYTVLLPPADIEIR